MRKIMCLSLVLVALLVFVGGVAGTANAGSYYLYADFTSSDGFLGGYDVDSYGDYLYVNRRNQIDQYTLTTAIVAGSDANTHPDNIGPDGLLGTADDNSGPMLARTLTHNTTYSIPAIGTWSVSEIFAVETGLYFLDDQSDVSFFDFSTTTVSKVTAASSTNLSQLGRTASGTWIASNESDGVYSYNDATSSWDFLFSHTNFPGGDHLDGLEVALLDGIEYIFISDMYADNIGRYDFAGNLLETYTYPGSGSSIVVEGMGFGANDHFWMTGSGHLYEVGGGALTWVDDDDGDGGDDNQPVPEPGTILLLGAGLIGLAVGRKKLKK